MRTTIIGAGVLGAAMAWELKKRGHHVTVLERSKPGGGTSRTTFAMDITARKTPRHYFELSLHSGRRHNELAAEISASEKPAWLNRVPSIEIGRTEHDRTVMMQRRERLREWGYDSEIVDPSTLSGLTTGLDLTVIANEIAFIYPNAAWYDPEAFVQQVLRASGAELHTGCTVTALTPRADGGWVVHAGPRTFEADWVINCAGPDAGRIAAMVGVDLPLDNVPGVIGYVGPLEGVDLHAVLSLWDLNIRPTSEGGLCLHSYPVDAQLDPGSANNSAPPAHLREDLHARAANLVPALAAVPTADLQFRVGTRPVPVDGLPLVGTVEAAPRFYTIATHSAVHLAPALAELAAEEVSSGKPSKQLDPYRITRPLTQAIDESLQEMTHTYRKEAS